jgi:hypothetical protein
MDKKPTKKPKTAKKDTSDKHNLSFEKVLKLAATTVVKNKSQKS